MFNSPTKLKLNIEGYWKKYNLFKLDLILVYFMYEK